MNEPTAPKIEFPCRYPVKIMGLSGETFRTDVVRILEQHTGTVADCDVAVRASTGGNYEALTITITATGIDQLQALFEDLKTHPQVRMVL